MDFTNCIALVVAFLVLSACIAQGLRVCCCITRSARVWPTPDYSASPVKVKATGDMKLRKDGVFGAAARSA